MERSIFVSMTSGVAFATARELLASDTGILFGGTGLAGAPHERRFSMKLGVDVGAGASVHQVVDVHLGAVRLTEAGAELSIAWQSSSRERLLPTFDGRLAVSAVGPGTLLELAGAYRVPLGAVGRFGDGVLGHRFARQSLEALMRRVATQLEHARLEVPPSRHTAPGQVGP